MDKARLLYLIQRYANDAATPAEQKELSDFIADSPDDELFTEALMEQMERHPSTDGDVRAFEGIADQALLLSRLNRPETLPAMPRRRHIQPWVWAAACALVLVIGGVYLGRYSRSGHTVVVSAPPKPASTVISPGKNGAILTLSDGSTIALDSLGNGKIATQQGSDVFIRQGKLTYAAASASSGEPAYNTLSTPKGRQYHIQLPDGTEVWLNAASSLHYPTLFSGADRVVDVTGEAYFEVAKDAAHPFKVRLGKSQIDVLGTNFNVNAYNNEPAIATTLLEGSVRFSTGDGKSQLLKPGEQTRFDQATQALTLTDTVTTSSVVAWKNGIFDFNNMGLREVMQQLERWYDIDVKYEKKVPKISFYGKMTKNIQLADLLTILERSK
ncbi:MAG TPA: FecR domain-containing protein, partial [Puia sp.]|nr:FecR domain-containing protein [Puia sp.]